MANRHEITQESILKQRPKGWGIENTVLIQKVDKHKGNGNGNGNGYKDFQNVQKGPRIDPYTDGDAVDEGVHWWVNEVLNPLIDEYKKKNPKKDIVKLSTGAPGELPLTCTLDNGVKVYEERDPNNFGYQPPEGHAFARKLWAWHLNRWEIFGRGRNATPITAEELLVTGGGGKAALNAIGRALRSKEGRNIAVVTPGYGGHFSAALKATEGNRNGGIAAIPVDIETGQPAPNTYEILETIDADAIFLSAPQNPVGQPFKKNNDGVKGIIEFVATHPETILIPDVVYHSQTHDKKGSTFFADIPEIRDQTTPIDVFSKGEANPAARLTAVAIPNAMRKFREAVKRKLADEISCGSTSETVIMSAAFSERGEKETMERVKLYREKIKVFEKAAREYDLISSGVGGAWYKPVQVYEEVSDKATATNFSKYLTQEHGVLSIPGAFFGDFHDSTGKPRIIDIFTNEPIYRKEESEKWIRVALVASKEDIKEGVLRIGEAIKIK